MSKPLCPDCGHEEIVVNLTCHTWPQGERWMSCQGCDSALNYYCTCWLRDEDGPPECNCMWDYTHGLNKYNPRYSKEEESRPEWLVGDLEFTEQGGFPIKISGIPWVWE